MGAEEEENEEPKKNECEEEAIRLALKYNFVTDLTSLVIEENDEYINKGPIQIGKKPASTYPGIRASGGLAYSSYAYSAQAPSPNLQMFQIISIQILEICRASWTSTKKF